MIDMVAAKWDNVALRLYFESYDISRIERDHPQQCVQASITVFTEWIEGKGRQPSSWHTLIEALKETRLKSVASDLENMFGMLSYVVNAIDYFVLLHYSVDQYQPVQYQNSDGTTSQSLQKMYMSCSINGNNYYDI